VPGSSNGAAVAAVIHSDAEVRERVQSVDYWYHTFEFPDGTVTEGIFDHRRVLPKLPIPASLHGKRCLDLASADGLFAFEMARRGGDVVSVDLEDATSQDYQGTAGPPPDQRTTGARERFEIVKWATGLDVERVDMNLYDVSSERVGTFDFVFMGNILLHLGDPGRVLRNVRNVTTGQFLSFETVSLPLTLLRPRSPCASLGIFDEPRWWTVNTAGHRRLMAASGLDITHSHFPLIQPFGTGFKKRAPGLRRVPPTPWGMHLALQAFNKPVGVACQWLLCR